jgi:hypothetical protein
MTIQKVIESFQEALGKGDIPTAFSFFNTDVKWHQPGNHKFSGIKNGVGPVQQVSATPMTSNGVW